MQLKMKLFLMLVVAIGIVNGQEFTKGIPRNTVIAPVNYEDPTLAQDCATVRKTTVCTGCNALALCVAGVVVPGRACPAATPYCVRIAGRDACQSLPDQSVPECIRDTNNNKIWCNSLGIFPDPRRCGTYHECLQVEAWSYIYDCPAGYVFDAANQRCKRSTLARDCITVTCNNDLYFQPYGTSKKYYAYCISPNEILMFKCADGETFDGNGCNYRCARAGKFSNSDDPAKYFECYILNGRLVFRPGKCQGNTIFNAATSRCVLP